MAPLPMPQPTTGKRKRIETDAPQATSPSSLTIQIITGSYERVLHGITTTITPQSSSGSEPPTVTFTNNFLFNAHASSIRCLALSPPSEPVPNQPSKRFLATGSTDERINLYQINAAAPDKSEKKPSPLPLVTTTSHGNREVGSLLHHASAISALHFPSRVKLLSASLDNTIAITRVRDWTVLSTIKAPIPKPVGRPSGDTAAPGEVPAGINDVALHPSAKLCLSVGQGERCMRLWNLVTGKRAGVLTFEKDVLALVGEARWRGGEARQVVWSPNGEEFAVLFERGAATFGLDCQVRGVIRVPGTKTCQFKYVPLKTVEDKERTVLAISTEDGRVLFFDTDPTTASEASETPAPPTSTPRTNGDLKADSPVSIFLQLAQVGTASRGSRVKDFEFFDDTQEAQSDNAAIDQHLLLATASSNGDICIWSFSATSLLHIADEKPGAATKKVKSDTATEKTAAEAEKQMGMKIGIYETGRRLTCLTGFVMGSKEVEKTLTESTVVAGAEEADDAVDAEQNEEEEEFEGFDGKA